jgi:hypothetical protein
MIILAVALIVSSLVLYTFHFLMFSDMHHILIYGLGELAFLPIEVLLVTLVIDRLLEASEKRAMLNKLNMVIGTFFSEVGTEFIRRVSALDLNFGKIRRNLIVMPEWTDKTFAATKASLDGYEYHIRADSKGLIELKQFLVGKRDFLLRLLENPNLLEHESFSELLWSVFHLTEELDARQDLTKQSEADTEHLVVDIKRAYIATLREWLDYMRHLKRSYPYLFSLAVRTNPFDPDAQVEIP